VPELPEVETICHGIRPFIENQIVFQLIIRKSHLRWPIPKTHLQQLIGQTITQIKRRGKYLLFVSHRGSLILHLGMSGRLRLLDSPLAPTQHDHVDISFTNGTVLRFTDPRRFGSILWTSSDPQQHPLLKNLGIEPLTRQFTHHYLHKRLQKKTLAIKLALMDQKLIVGIGNIYVTEALFMASIHPLLPAKSLSLDQLKRLVVAIKTILRRAIQKGGTTLKDFLNSQGKPGYFNQKLQVYGRSGLPCLHCQSPLQLLRLGQRSTVYCERCQTH
jgi:formamidopyrimidine-DNA glycosylase